MTERANEEARVPASFRDPSGFLFWKDGVLYRQIKRSYTEEYDTFIESGLYRELTACGMLLSHEEVSDVAWNEESAYKTIKPEFLNFISYPYEWSFGQLKDAALLTLEIQKKAFAAGMTLKDASAYNVQFRQGKPIFIDTLSFERYEKGAPWVAYRQFCQHFLAPLALMSFRDIRLGQLLRIHLDGIPLDLASALLPWRTRFSFGLFSHVHLHAKSQKYFADKVIRDKKQKHKIGTFSHLGLIDSLEGTVKKLQWNKNDTEWGAYYENTNYQKEAFKHKKQIVEEFLGRAKPKSVWDIGANTGEFSRLASNQGIPTVSFDVDPVAVEKNYSLVKEKEETKTLPLLLDFTNPSPGLGWENAERMPILQRGPADTVLALALIHHLAISNNLPFAKIAHFFSNVCQNSLIIEFIPKKDSNVQRLLATRKDIFPDYTQAEFEKTFQPYFVVREVQKIKNSERTLYLMKKR